MTARFTPPQERAAWKRLQALADGALPHLRELLAEPSDSRPASLQLEAAGLRLDASHQQVTPEVLQALLALAAESRVLEQAQAQRRGEAINATENRAVLHMALRGADMPDAPWGAAISDAVRTELDRFLDAAERIRDGRWRGHRGQRIANVINIGIGGSDLGPRMAVQALDAYASNDVRVHFVSNPDAWALHSILRWCDPDSTLFIVQSKTFTTQETMTLAASAKRWLAERHGTVEALNAAWGTVFWSQEYRSFEEIDPPVGTVTEAGLESVSGDEGRVRGCVQVVDRRHDDGVHPRQLSAPFGGRLPPRAVHQNPPHRLRDDRERVASVRPQRGQFAPGGECRLRGGDSLRHIVRVGQMDFARHGAAGGVGHVLGARAFSGRRGTLNEMADRSSHGVNPSMLKIRGRRGCDDGTSPSPPCAKLALGLG